MSARRLAGPLVLLAAGWALTWLLWPWSDRSITDTLIYQQYAHFMLGGALPFRDFAFEYPPLAAPVLALAGVAGTGDWAAYDAALGVLLFAAAAGCLVLVAGLAERAGGSGARAAWAFALLPLVMGALVREHFDLAPLALALGGLALVSGGRRVVLGFAVLGAGVMMKAFPLLVAVPALAWLWGRGERRAAARGAAAMCAVIVLAGAATYAIGPAGARWAWSYQADRPVQVESLPAVALRALDAAGGPAAQRVAARNGDALVGSADWAVSVASWALLFAALGAFALCAASSRGRRELVLAALAALAAAMALGKVLSPQYVIWCWPLVAVAFALRLRALAAFGLAAAVLTFVEFPFRYHAVAAGETLPVLIVAARDLALVGVSVEALRALLPLGRNEQLLDGGRAPVRGRLDEHPVQPDVLV